MRESKTVTYCLDCKEWTEHIIRSQQRGHPSDYTDLPEYEHETECTVCHRKEQY